MAVDAEHSVKLGLARQRRAVSDKAAQAPFFNVARHRIAL